MHLLSGTASLGGTGVHSHVTAWGWFWLTWAEVGLGVEIYWVIVNAANTLSRQIWGIEGLDLSHPLRFSDWTWLHWLISISQWFVSVWLSLHFPFGYLR